MKSKFLLWIIFIAIVLIWFWKSLRNYGRSVLLALRMPGPKPIPLVGNILMIKNDTELQYTGNNTSTLYGPIFRAWVFHIPIFFLYEPEHLKIVLGGGKIQTDKNFFYSLAKTFLGEGLVTNNGYKWRKNRRLIQPYFSVNILENYFDMFSMCAEEIVNKLNVDSYINITKIVNVAVVRSLHKAVLGITLNDIESSPFRNGEMLIIKRTTQPWLLLDPIFQYTNVSKNESKQKNSLREFTKQAIKERVEARKLPTKNEYPCLLDMLLEIHDTNTEFTEEDVISETITFMLAGQDSVGTALAMCLYYLAKHPEVQEKAQNEIDDVIYADDLKTIKIEQLNQMHYLEQCIKESLRLAPSIPIVFRVLKSDVNLGTYTVPAGSNICVSPFMTHRLPHYFPNPQEYNPDRFSAENVKKMHPFAFIPFSAGPRNCIGFKFAILQMKTVLASILKTYELRLQPGKEDLNLSYRVTLRVKGGIWLNPSLRHRNNQ